MNKDFAIIATGGKQYRVSPGDKLKVEKLPEAGENISFGEVLLRSVGGNVEVGAPHVADVTVQAKLLRNDKEKTKIVFRFHSKTRYRKKKGHRQEFSEVEILKI
jgi:large subunit ribosomal protein L21